MFTRPILVRRFDNLFVSSPYLCRRSLRSRVSSKLSTSPAPGVSTPRVNSFPTPSSPLTSLSEDLTPTLLVPRPVWAVVRRATGRRTTDGRRVTGRPTVSSPQALVEPRLGTFCAVGARHPVSKPVPKRVTEDLPSPSAEGNEGGLVRSSRPCTPLVQPTITPQRKHKSVDVCDPLVPLRT